MDPSFRNSVKDRPLKSMLKNWILLLQNRESCIRFPKTRKDRLSLLNQLEATSRHNLKTTLPKNPIKLLINKCLTLSCSSDSQKIRPKRKSSTMRDSDSTPKMLFRKCKDSWRKPIWMKMIFKNSALKIIWTIMVNKNHFVFFLLFFKNNMLIIINFFFFIKYSEI